MYASLQNEICSKPGGECGCVSETGTAQRGHSAVDTRVNLSEFIEEILSIRAPKRIPDEKCQYRHAGVLVPLFEENGMYQILFTKRTTKVEHHKGQISFPGGSVDKEDNSIKETVLREAREEIGLDEKDVKILGRIDDTLTVVSNFVVHPYVGIIPYPYDFTINKDEVERLIMVPLEVFHPRNWQNKGSSFEFEGDTYLTPTYDYKGEVIWGATARIMEGFMDTIAPKLPL
jgi:8-oxo-dGTP pyrophosphatase MutT (NUDIX family)